MKQLKIAGLLFTTWRPHPPHPPPPQPPTLFNDSRPCFFLRINYLSLFQWQRTAHWSRPFLKPRHTSGIYCKLKARVCSTKTCTIKLPSFRFFFQNQRDPRQLNPSNVDMLGYSQWHLASQRHAAKNKRMYWTGPWKLWPAKILTRCSGLNGKTQSEQSLLLQ